MVSSNALQMYALIDAESCSPQTMEAVKRIISTFGRRIRHGFMVSPHGSSQVVFFEIAKKEGPIVEVLTSLAEQYVLYPVYVVQEHKDHLPKHAKNVWYMVEEVKFEVPDMTEEKVEEWRHVYATKLKQIYKDDSVFIKSFFYLGKSGTLHVMSFNSERNPKYTGTELGVPEWHEMMEKILKEFDVQNVFKASVRYTNL